MDIAVEEFDMVTKAFDRPSEDFVDDMLGTFPALEAKTGQVGAGRIGWGCKTATDDTPEANEDGGRPSSCPWWRKFIFAFKNKYCLHSEAIHTKPKQYYDNLLS